MPNLNLFYQDFYRPKYDETLISLRSISLGAGVQSTTLALMAAHGEIGPTPDIALFADTGWEKRATYAHLDWLKTILPFPVESLSFGDIRQELMKANGRNRCGSFPAFVLGHDGSIGMMRRQCTSNYKLRPMRRRGRELLGLVNKRSPQYPIFEQWIGISIDEACRAKPSRESWIGLRYPLLELGMSRQDCITWLKERGYPVPPKSSCVGCPFHDDAGWRDIQKNEPDSWKEALEVDKAIRHGLRGVRGEAFLHRSAKPLETVDFKNAEDKGQLNWFDVYECEGVCGT